MEKSPVEQVGVFIDFNSYLGADTDGSLREFDFQEFEGKYLVLIFFPDKFTAEDSSRITDGAGAVASVQVVGVAPEGWLEKYRGSEAGLGWEIGFPLRSDPDFTLAKLFGVKPEDNIKMTFILDLTRTVRYTRGVRDSSNDFQEIFSLVAEVQMIDEEGDPEVVKEEQIEDLFGISDYNIDKYSMDMDLGAVAVAMLVLCALALAIAYNVYESEVE